MDSLEVSFDESDSIQDIGESNQDIGESNKARDKTLFKAMWKKLPENARSAQEPLHRRDNPVIL
ncbi:hypothetical protein HMPREF3192_00533 [Atopobium deltae]|uniref:Uncharacterized protein n=1 Tax=Atopobium deltae TaxID=1393034 RepID=A0A133XW54_9ACTN|nr:hypothetical protein HMPREF3192_00533 [Atopobium deltae]